MHFIFCASPLDKTKPDEEYRAELSAARQRGETVSLIDFEALAREGDADKALVNLTEPRSGGEMGIYRGWMLSPARYKLLYSALQRRGIELINDPVSYRQCHYLPDWVELFEGRTPKSVWIESDKLSSNLLESVMEKLKVFGSKPVVLKDFVKSEKDHWQEACFIPDASDREAVQRVVTRFLELRGDALEGGLVFREYVDLKPLGQRSKSDMPLTREYRLFVFAGKIVYWTPYWEEGDYGDGEPPLGVFAPLARKPESNFFSMDVAQTKADQWVIVELGDGQVSGLPDDSSVDDFYTSLCRSGI